MTLATDGISNQAMDREILKWYYSIILSNKPYIAYPEQFE